MTVVSLYSIYQVYSHEHKILKDKSLQDVGNYLA